MCLGLLEAARANADHMAPINNISDEKVSFTSVAMTLVKKDREGPHMLEDTSRSAVLRRREDAGYRPKSLQRVAADVEHQQK